MPLLDYSRNSFILWLRFNKKGTGLHTFVLFLGPWIAKYTIASYSCQFLPEFETSRWNQLGYFRCPQIGSKVSLISIFLAVYFESFLWGLGTAIGELPPYLVTKLGKH